MFLNELLRGSTLSDLGRYEEALEAYRSAAACPHAQPDVVRYNRALVYSRQNLPLQVLEECPADPTELGEETRALQAWALHALGRFAECESFCRESQESELQCYLALALRGQGRMREALLAAVEALRRNAWKRVLQELVEELADDLTLQRFLVFYEGPAQVRKCTGFMRSHHVVARDREDACARVRLEETVEVTVSKVEELGPFPAEFEGILASLGYIYY